MDNKNLMKWHSLSTESVLKHLDTNFQEGLGLNEVTKRRKIFGVNQLKKIKQESSLIRFLKQFHNILIYILIFSAVVTFLLGHIIDTSVIIGVVILNAIIGYIQEGKAEKALKAIRKLLKLKCTVKREGSWQNIPATELVPGDIVKLKPGDKIPADLRLIETKNLQIQESILTGESIPVDKNVNAVQEKTLLVDRTSMAYGGTLTVYGRGIGVVVETGKSTEVGKISALIENVKHIETPLIRQIEKFGKLLTFAIIAISLLTFLFGLVIWKNPTEELFMIIVGLAVAAIPEGLPAIMTITLAIGVKQMASRNAIIRKLPAVETMGSVTVICSDKTGTLTSNELTVKNIVTKEAAYYADGSGYNDQGDILFHNEKFKLNDHIDLKEFIVAGVLCNESELLKKDDRWKLYGNPTDLALLALGLKANKEKYTEHLHYPVLDILPFESQHKFMATLHKNGVIYVKGAPEYIFKRCQYQREKGVDFPFDLNFWNKEVHKLAVRGERVVAIAKIEFDDNKKTININDLDQNLSLIGICGIIDPPRVETIDAVAECLKAKVKVKMITGDHAITALSIANQIGLSDKNEFDSRKEVSFDFEKKVLTGTEIDQLSDLELTNKIENINVFARATPMHKLRIVKALQANNEVVAMTGDGINDAPALKQADIGIAMGEKGTDASKEVSEMVLADDNFASIKSAIKEGRCVYDNLKKAILYILPTNAGESFIIMFAIFFGQVLPISAVQILWINMITTVTFALAIGFEKPEEDVMLRPPRKQNTPLFTKFLIWRTFFVGTIVMFFCFLLFMYEQSISDDLAAIRTTIVNMVVAGEAVYLINCRKLTRATCNLKGLFESRAAVIAILVVIAFQLLFTYLPIMQEFFKTTAIGFSQWYKIILFSILLFFIIEFEKMVIRKFFN